MNTILSVHSLRRARKGATVIWKGTPYTVTKVSFRRDRLWLQSELNECLRVIIGKRAIARHDLKLAVARAEFRAACKQVRKETYGFIFPKTAS